MREEAVRAKELLQGGMNIDDTIEQLIVDGHFGDTKDIRKHLAPVVNEIWLQMNREQETSVSKFHECNNTRKTQIYTHGITGNWLMAVPAPFGGPAIDTIRFCPYCGKELDE